MEKMNLEMIRGDTLSFAFEVDFDEAPQKLEKADFSCKVNLDDDEALFHKELGNGIDFSKQDGNKLYYIVRIAPEDTENLEAGMYYYDLSIEMNGDVFTILNGTLKIESDVTTVKTYMTKYKGIEEIKKTNTSGLVDTYTITLTDGTTSTFTVTNGDSAYKPAVEALGKRIDNLILSSGTESSAEVTDARTGYDGTAYDTLGTAIRKQVNNLNKDLADIKIIDKNYFDLNKITRDKWIRNTNGAEDTYVGWSATDFIPTFSAEYMFAMILSNGSYTELNGVYGAFYNADKTFISGFFGKLSDTSIPSNAKYLRISQETRKLVKDKNQADPKLIVCDKARWETLPSVEEDYVSFGYNILGKNISKLESNVSELNNSIFGDELPQYTKDEIARVSNVVKSRQNVSSVSFAFITDPHNYNSDTIRNSNHHALLSMTEIEKNVSIDYCVFGGDYLSNSASTTIEECYEQLSDFVKYANKINTPKFYLRGNHDSNHFNSSQPFTDKMFYVSANKFVENTNVKMYTDDLGKSIGYVDLENLNIRLIFTNMTDVGESPSGFGITWQQMDWFGNVALNFSDKSDKEKWGIVVFAHSYFQASSITDGGLALAPQMHYMLKACKDGTNYTYDVNHSYDYTEQGSMDVICAVVGHWHSDRSAVVDGIQVIACIQTAGGGDEVSDDGNTYSKVYGTKNETGYDIFTIDRENRKIYCSRFGVGVDREFSY